ncbi:MAG: ABC transporter substrate-binding protein [Phycisphaerales bacterium]
MPSPRVVSLLPSATEALCAIGAGDLLVGRSHECDFPGGLEHLPVLTGQRTHATTSAAIDAEVRAVRDAAEAEIAAEADADAGEGPSPAASLYTLDVEQLRSLQPDVILTQDLCDVCSIDLRTVRGVAATLDPSPEIVSLNPASLEDVLDDLLTVGAAVDRAAEAHTAMVRLRESWWSAIDYVNPYVDGPEVAFLEWLDPIFVGGHWTPQLITLAGASHSLNAAGGKSITVTPDALVASAPQRLILCPCGWSIAETRRDLAAVTGTDWWNELPAVREQAVVIVDGNQMFNRPGPRLVDALRWLVGWLNDRPDVVPDGFPVEQL